MEKQTHIAKQAQEVYTWALENGIAKEQARAVLPEGMTPSRLYMNGTLRSWIHYLQLRTGEDTQKEHRMIAFSCMETISSIFPMMIEICKK